LIVSLTSQELAMKILSRSDFGGSIALTIHKKPAQIQLKKHTAIAGSTN
jgi:hypothetical protein